MIAMSSSVPPPSLVMADCTRTGLLYLTPLGSGCASSPQLSLTGSISQYTYRLYASMLDQGFLQATISPSATNNLRTIAAFAIVGALLGLALWGLLAYRHVKGTRKQRLLLIVDNEEGGNTYLPNPTLAWSIPMTLLPILLAASCIIQQRMYGSSHSLIYGSMAYNGLVLLLFRCGSPTSSRSSSTYGRCTVSRSGFTSLAPCTAACECALVDFRDGPTSASGSSRPASSFPSASSRTPALFRLFSRCTKRDAVSCFRCAGTQPTIMALRSATPLVMRVSKASRHRRSNSHH